MIKHIFGKEFEEVHNKLLSKKEINSRELYADLCTAQISHYWNNHKLNDDLIRRIDELIPQILEIGENSKYSGDYEKSEYLVDELVEIQNLIGEKI